MAEWGDPWGELWGGAIATIEDHGEQAVDRLPFFHKDKAPQIAIQEIYAERWQRIENILSDIETLFDIERGTGFALDAIGENIGISRLGFDDSFYRVLLDTQSSIVIPGRRTVEGLLTMMRALLNDDIRPIIYKESPIKTYTVELVDLTADEIGLVQRFGPLAKPATYNGFFISSASDGFVFDDSTATITVSGEGFADATGTIDVGGGYSYIIPT